MVDTKSCLFNDGSTSRSVLTTQMCVATKEVRIHAMIPNALISTGTETDTQSDHRADWLEMTRAAQLPSAKDPNKSAPIPAMSPTLSPTLSAMQAGFRGSSSSKLFS